MQISAIGLPVEGNASLVCDGQLREMLFYDPRVDNFVIQWDTLVGKEQLSYRRVLELTSMRKEALHKLVEHASAI